MTDRIDLKEVKVAKLPDCDFCNMAGLAPRKATYDGATTQGSWGYMCQEHFNRFGVGLGTGKGQKLVVADA